MSNNAPAVPKEALRTLLLLIRDGRVLLAMKKRGFGAGYYNGVGGKIHYGETVEQALIRECQEEINVTPLSYHKVAEHDFHGPAGTESWRMFIHTYICEQWTGEPSESDEMKPEWFAFTDIPYDRMWADDPFWLPQVLRGERVRGEYHFGPDDNLLHHHVETVTEL